ncbi:MAG: hydroxylase [Streptosporangiales bacterium]|nr:hydroxylase [Streptosporangiales bacterium]
MSDDLTAADGPSAPAGPDGTADGAGSATAAVELLGLLAYAELVASLRMAEDAAMAPSLSGKATLAGLAATEYGHFTSLRDRLTELGTDPEEAMRPFVAALDDFHAGTRPSGWLEGLVKVYVGDGIAADFYREIAGKVDERTREIVLASLADTEYAAFVVDEVRAAIEVDPKLAGRLALWARRLVGEALSQAQRVAAEHAELATLIVGGDDADTDVAKIFGRLYEAHTARMNALGLAI